MNPILETFTDYEIGYFDDGQFWSCRSASSLQAAKEILKTFPIDSTNLDDGLCTKYLIVKRTISYEFV